MEQAGGGGNFCASSGGYSGGGTDGALYPQDWGINGKSNHTKNIRNYDLCFGGGYFEGPRIGDKFYNQALGGMGSCGHAHTNTTLYDGCYHLWGVTLSINPSLSGKITADQTQSGGKGGEIKVSKNSKIYAFNGNRYTDGTDYQKGINQCPIYIQNGIITAKYKWKFTGDNTKDISCNTTNTTMVQTSAQKTINKTGYVNKYYSEKSVDSNLTINPSISILTNINMTNQGIGSGAGYIEVSNGTYKIDSSLN